MNKKITVFKKAAIPVLSVAIVLFVLLWFIFSVGNTAKEVSAKEKYDLELAIRRAAASCYAIEGAYPESLEYIEEHYGIQIDHERFNVFYEVFAENIMPDITVV